MFQSNLFVPKSLWNRTHRNFKVRPTSYGPSTAELPVKSIKRRRPCDALRIRETSSRSWPFSSAFYSFISSPFELRSSRRSSLDGSRVPPKLFTAWPGTFRCATKFLTFKSNRSKAKEVVKGKKVIKKQTKKKKKEKKRRSWKLKESKKTGSQKKNPHAPIPPHRNPIGQIVIHPHEQPLRTTCSKNAILRTNKISPAFSDHTRTLKWHAKTNTRSINNIHAVCFLHTATRILQPPDTSRLLTV